MKAKDQRNRGQVVSRGDNRWLVRVFIGSDIDQDGKRKRKYVSETIDGTFSEAQKALTKKLSEIDTQSFVEPSKLTIEQYCKQWLEGKVDLRAGTREDYKNRLQSDVYPALGRIRMDKLTPLQVQQFVGSLSARKLSPRTVQYTMTVLKSALADAVETGILAKNPCRAMKLPKRPRKPPVVWDTPSVQTFLRVTEATPDHTLWLTELTSGMRPEEYLALQWPDVDFANEGVSITRALNDKEGGGQEVGDLKTDASRRFITLPKETLEALRRYRAKQNAVILAAGEQYQRHGFVFAGPTGNFQDISAVRRRFKAALKKAGLKDIPLYNLRHTHATMLLTAGEHPKVVQERLGHSSITVTMDTYSHVLMSLQTKTAESLSSMLFTSTQAVANA
jgi:integrase